MRKPFVKFKKSLFLILNVARERGFPEFVFRCGISSLEAPNLSEGNKIMIKIDGNASKLKIGA
jgi:hypothetical protein